MDDFTPLAPALQGYYSLSFEQLPPEIQERIRQDFYPIPWDRLTPEKRQQCAERWDYEHNPTTRAEYLAVGRFIDELESTEARVTLWEKIAAPTALDLAAKEQVLESLKPKRDQLRARQCVLRGDMERLEGQDSPPAAPISASDAALGAQRREQLTQFSTKNRERRSEREREWERWRGEAQRIQSQSSRRLSKLELAKRVKQWLELTDAVDTIRQKL